MGLGGGSVFLLAALLFENTTQLQAQGMNLFFFLPVGLVSLLLHQKNRLISWRTALPVIFGGLAGSVGGAFLAPLLPGDFLRNALAFLLLFLGTKELFSKPAEPENTPLFSEKQDDSAPHR